MEDRIIINYKETYPYKAFRLFTRFTGNTNKFTYVEAYNFLVYGTVDDYGYDMFDTHELKRAFRKILNCTLEAFVLLHLPYSITKQYRYCYKNSDSNLYIIYKTEDNIINDYDIDNDDIEIIKNYIPFYIHIKLERKEYLSIDMLINLLSLSKSSIYRIIDKMNMILEMSNYKYLIKINKGKLEYIDEKLYQI